jgi:UDP-N-acetylglucosamine--N-acetylmuramyl-(pentapeptide) pyrophosphoryl-undecaprenol N-acetylglucosamine transferase
MMKKILFTGGGSAGHVIPNVALIEEILSSGKADVCYMGTNGIEKSVIAEWKIPYYEISCPKLIRGGGWQGLKNNLRIPARFFHAVKQAEKGLLLLQPSAVFSKGGYAALPVVFAAKKLKIPCFAHESDFSLGLANRISLRKCEKVFTSFPETAKKNKKCQYSGAPLRRSVFSATKADARKKLNIPFQAKVLLVFGGGSGSQSINLAILKHLKTLTKHYYILHVCGKGNTVDCRAENYRQFEFVSDMGMLYACADGVVARSGAGTVFEIMALKKPAIFIPLEGQTRGDQAQNAAYFQKRGLCRMLSQNKLELLPKAIDLLFSDEPLKSRLNESNFTSGNEKILQALYKVVR